MADWRHIENEKSAQRDATEPKIFAPTQTPFPGAQVWYGIVEFNVPLDTV